MEPDEDGTVEFDSFLGFVQTHGDLDVAAVEGYLDRVLCGRRGVILEWDDVVVRLGVEETEWGMLSTPRRSVSTQALWRYMAALLDFPPDAIERAPEKWHDGEIGDATETTPRLDARSSLVSSSSPSELRCSRLGQMRRLPSPDGLPPFIRNLGSPAS